MTTYIKNTPSFPISKISSRYSKTHKIISYQISKVLFNLSEAFKIIQSATSWENATKAGNKSFGKFLLKNYGILEHEIIPIKQAYEYTKNNCNKQSFFLSKKGDTFSKLTSILFAISDGNTQTIDNLAIMFAKIFIGGTYLKILDPENTLTNFTIIHTDSPKYIRDFLVDIFSSDITFTNLKTIKIAQTLEKVSSFVSSNPNITTQKISNEPLISEYSSKFLCDENNLSKLIRDTIVRKIVNVDISSVKITSSKFKNLINRTTLYDTQNSLPLNEKLSYKSNSHYIKISSSSITDIIDDSFTSDLYSSIFFEGPLANAAKYQPLASYEVFFMVTGFVIYGIDLLLKQLSSSTDSENQRINNNESIHSFISEFYLDTFDISKASFNQKEDTNDFAAADDDLYENYKRWFSIIYKTIPCCSSPEFKNVLKDFYKERPTKKNSSLENSNELNQRYLKLNKMSCRGVSGLKFQKDKFDSFLADSKQHNALDPYEKKDLFNTYLSSLFTNYCPYSK